MAEFKKGDMVKLKSGGPVMTVGEVNNEKAICHWFNQSGAEYTAQSAVFVLEMLKPAPLQT